jgi:single-strand DNA-binding protein
MASLNRVELLGRVGKDPEIRSSGNGDRIASFSLATSESWKDRNSGERKEKTEWHRIVVFNDGLVGVIEQYVSQGSQILIEGSLQTRKWTDKSGQERFTTEVVVPKFGGRLILLGGKDSERKSDDRPSAKPFPYVVVDNMDDEIPF